MSLEERGSSSTTNAKKNLGASQNLQGHLGLLGCGVWPYRMGHWGWKLGGGRGVELEKILQKNEDPDPCWEGMAVCLLLPPTLWAWGHQDHQTQMVLRGARSYAQ